MTTRKAGGKFPLWWHAGANAWCKKIRGKFYYFGPDKDAALARYVEIKTDIDAGRTPRAKAGTLAVRELVNPFLSNKRDLVESGELTAGPWGEYFHVCEAVVEQLGKDGPVSDFGPMDFAKLRASAAKRLGPVPDLLPAQAQAA